MPGAVGLVVPVEQVVVRVHDVLGLLRLDLRERLAVRPNESPLV